VKWSAELSTLTPPLVVTQRFQWPGSAPPLVVHVILVGEATSTLRHFVAT